MRKEMQQRLMARIRNVVGTGTVTGASTRMLQIKASTGKTSDKLKRIHNYGFMSRPLVGAKTYNLFIGGATARGFTVNVEDERYQMELQPGEVAVLDDKGNLIHFTEKGIKVNASAKLEIISAQATTVKAPEVSVTAPKSTFSGDVDIGGKLKVEGAVSGASGMFGGVSSTEHTHNYADDAVQRVSQRPNK